MERKAIHALLLSGIVAAGAMTIGDVYAQTNTDRLIAVVDNTDGLPGMLDTLMTAISDGVASILAAISSLETHVDDGLHAIDDDLMAIDADLQSIHGDLTNVDADLQAVHGDLSAIDADLANIHEDLMNVDADLVTIHDDLEMVHGDLTTMDGKIAGLTQTVNAMGQASAAITGLADANTATQEGVNANSAAINELKDLLMGVSEAVGAVQETVEAEPEEGTVTTGTKLFSDDNKFSVLVSAFGQNKPSDSSYTTTLTFSCEEHVFLNTAKVADATVPFTGTGTASETSIVITADGINVYNTDFRLVASDIQSEYSAGASFNLKPLAAGDEIKVKVSTDRTGLDNGVRVAAERLADTGDKRFTLHDYVNASTRDRVANLDDNANITKLAAGKMDVFKLDMSWYSGAADAGLYFDITG